MRFRTALLITAALAALAFLTNCQTDTGDPAKDRRARVTNAALQSAADFAGRVALATLQNAAETSASGAKIDLAHSAAEGLWSQSATIVSDRDVQRVMQAWSGNDGRLDTIAAANAAAFRQADPRTPADRARVVNQLAQTLSTAAFDATGQP